METIIAKEIRRAQIKLLKRAEVEAEELKTSVKEAFMGILLKAATDEALQDTVVKVFSQVQSPPLTPDNEPAGETDIS